MPPFQPECAPVNPFVRDRPNVARAFLSHGPVGFKRCRSRLVFFPLSFTLGEGLLTIFLISSAHRRLSWRLEAIDAIPGVFRLMRHSRDGFFIGILADINFKVDVIVLGYFLSDAAVGLYILMAMFADGFAQLPVVLQNILYPLLSKFRDLEPRKSVRPYLVRLHLYVVPVMLLIAGIATLILPSLADFLTGDPKFGAACCRKIAILATGIAITSGFSPLFFVLN